MRRSVLPFLACPHCGGDLVLIPDGLQEDAEHVMAGALSCSACGGRFPVREGVPVILSRNVEAVKIETASRFAKEWLHWSDLRDFYEKEFFDWVAPLTAADFIGQNVFEGGCGKGRHTALVASRGAKAIVAMDLGESAFVAFAHTRNFPNAHVVIGDLLKPPVRPVFDLAFSVGVLHHLPDPAAGFASLASWVRDGGRVAFWVYGKEGNGWITRYVNPIRVGITSKLPSPLLRVLSVPPSIFLWAVIKLFYRPRENGKVSTKLPYGDYFAAMYSYPFDEIHANVFDQLVTPVAFYLTGDEVRAWFATGFDKPIVRSHRGYRWTGMATISRGAKSQAAPSNQRV